MFDDVLLFFFFFHHYQLFSSSRLCWHVRVSYASIVIGSTGSAFDVSRVWLSLSVFFSFKEEKWIHNTTPSVDLTLTRRQLNTTPLNEVSYTIMYKHEWSSDKIVFISFFPWLVWSSFLTPKHNRIDVLQWIQTTERQTNSSLELTHLLSIYGWEKR